MYIYKFEFAKRKILFVYLHVVPMCLLFSRSILFSFVLFFFRHLLRRNYSLSGFCVVRTPRSLFSPHVVRTVI